MRWGTRSRADECRRLGIMVIGHQRLGQVGQGIFPLLAARHNGGENAFDIATAGTGLCAEGAVTLPDAMPLRAFREIVGGFHPFDAQEGPQRRFQLAQVMAQRFGFGIGVMAFTQQRLDRRPHRGQRLAELREGQRARPIGLPGRPQRIRLLEQFDPDVLGEGVRAFD